MKNNTKTKFYVFVLILSFILGGFFVVKAVFAEDSTEDKIDEKQKDVQEIQAQIDKYTKQIQELEARERNLKDEITIREQEIEVSKLAIEKTGQEIDNTSSEISLTNDQIEQKKKELGMQKSVLSDLIREIKRQDDESVVNLFLKEDSFSSLLNSRQYTENYEGKTHEILLKVIDLKTALENKVSSLEEKKKELEVLKQTLDAQKQEAQRQKNEQQGLLDATQNSEDKYQLLIGDAAEEQKKLAEEIVQLEQIHKPNITKTPVQIGNGLLKYPMGGSGDITQGYGHTSYSNTGVYGRNADGSTRIHNGIDLGKPCGEPIMAAADGRVVGTASLRYGFGKWVAVEHKDIGITTLYAHMSTPAVVAGQQVIQGQVIGFEGTTGFSTGCHLHFTVFYLDQFYTVETSYGVSPAYNPEGTINPMSYL